MSKGFKQRLRLLLVKTHYFFWASYIRFKNKSQNNYYTNAEDIPIIINNRNRYTFLKQLIRELEKRNYKNIYIIDNDSTYPPLLDFYKNCPYKIYYLKQNVGFRSLWQTDLYKKFIHNYYVYTDSDVVPTKECPENFLQILLNKMREDKSVFKIGLSLKTDDLPDSFNKKKEVIAWEKQYSEIEYDSDYYLAKVDTTFALYRPYMKFDPYHILQSYRSKAPLQAYHMPWYNDSENISEEEQYYLDHVKTLTHWSK